MSNQSEGANQVALNRDFVDSEYSRLTSGGAAVIEHRSSIEPRLAALYRTFRLEPAAIDLLLLCLAPIFGRGSSDATDEGLPMIVTPRTLSDFKASEHQAWADFCFGDNEMFELGLLYYDTDDLFNHNEMDRPIRVHRRLVQYLHSADSLPSGVRDYLKFAQRAEGSHDAPDFDEKIGRSIKSISEYLKGNSVSSLLHFHGPDGTGKSRAALQICEQISIPCLKFDLRRILARPDKLETMLELTRREARLVEAAVLVPDWHLLKEERHIDSEFVISKLQSATPVVILASEAPFSLPRKGLPLIDVAFEATDHSSRVASWKAHLNGDHSGGKISDLQSIAGLYKFNDGQIRSVVERARLRSLALTGSADLSESELIAGCREESSQNLAELAVKVETRHSWDYLILPEDQKAQLRELCNHMKYRSHVYENWAYHTRVTAQGLNALFTGPPGTGKTLAASIIANELGLDLYKVDLSTVVSKYIGETEKNLSKIFKEAESSNAILFFDEADSLFGKRSAVRDAHDRYANIQVGYLLQKMEEFPGMTILASNLIENIDDAFMRRLHFSVDFPFPAAPEREKIWSVSFPEQAPLADDVDFEKLGRRVKVPGGNIRNIALHAAFHAAADESEITLRHIARAARREYEKEGRSLDS